MQRVPGWSALLPGLAVFGVVAAVAVVILVFGRVGKLHGRTTRLYITTSQARGVIAGTDVWLAGEKVGRVEGVEFRPPATDTSQRLLIALDVFESVRPLVRRDTRAQIRPGGSLIGAPVVHLVGGSAAAPEVAPGDTLMTIAPHEFGHAEDQIAQVAEDLPVVLDNFQSVRNQLFSTRGTIGALGSDSGTREFRALNQRAARLSARATRRLGTLSRFDDGELIGRIQRALATADSLRRQASARHAFGATGDSSIRRSVRDSRLQLDSIQEALGAPDSDAARRSSARPDLAQLRQQVAATAAQMHRLEADMARRPLRYFVF